MNTKVIALGTGSAFTMKGRQTNFVINRNEKNLLIDCGGDIRFSLQDHGLGFKDIDGIYISHAHNDHVGGLEFLGFATYFTRQAMINSGAPNPIPLNKMFCERELMRDLWDHTLRGGMEGLEGIDARLDTYFDLNPIEKNSSFEWEGITFDLVQSLHVSAKYSIVNSFGLMFTDPDNGKRVYITTDVQFAPESSLKAFYKESNVIIHDCETMYKSGVHAHYDDLITLPEETKKKVRLIHYQDNVLDEWEEWFEKVKKEGFYGLCEPGIIYSSDEQPALQS